MIPLNISSWSFISLFITGFISLHAQYSHFPITHLDWELIDFEEPSISVVSSVEEMDESMLPAIEDLPQVTLDSDSPFSYHSSSDDSINALTVGLSPVDSDESYLIDSPLPSYKQNSPKIVSTEPTPSLSVKILRFLEDLFVLDKNATDVSSFTYSSLIAHRTNHSFYLESHDFPHGSVEAITISKLTLPHAHPLNANDSIDRSASKKSTNKPTSLKAIFSKNANPTPNSRDSEMTAISPDAILHLAHPFHHSPPLSLDTTNISNSSNYIPPSKSNKISTMPNKKTEENYSRPHPNAFFNVFAAKFDEGNLQDRPYYFQRQRRANYTYVWEMTDFDDYNSTYNDTLAFSDGNYSNDTFTIIIKPLKDGAAVGTGDLNNSSATQGVANNMPVFPDNGIWSPSSRTYSNFLTFTNSTLPTVNVDASAVKYFMNWYYGDWEAEQNGNNFNLVYYSAAPEPSTYVMTGALVCFIGLNGRSRKAAIQLASALLMKLKFRQSEKNSTQLNAVS